MTPADRTPPAISRRRFLRSSAMAGLLSAVAAACAKNPTPTAVTALDATTTSSAGSPTTAGSPSTSAPTASTAPAAATASTAAGPAAEGELTVAFDYVASASSAAVAGGGGGRGGGVKNPYVAVWIENPAGASLRTIVLSHERKGGADKWLNELRRWFRADQARAAKGGKDVIATMSTPTKVPGSWKAVWDGKNDAGVGVPAGPYVVLIEASREHGGYQLVRHEFTFGGAAFEQILDGNGDVRNVNVALRSK